MGEELKELIFKIEDILDSISDWIVVIDNYYRIIYSNKSSEKIIGISKEEVIGKNCCKLIHDSDIPLKDCPLQKMKESGKREIMETFLPKFDKWITVTVDPVFNENKAITCPIHTMRDITEKKKAEEALKESEERFRGFFDQSQMGMAFYDENGHLIDINQACLDMFGIPSKTDVKGFELFEDPNMSDELMKKLRNGEIVRYEAIFDFELVKKHNLYKTNKSGKMWTNVVLTPLSTEGKPFGYVGMVHDVTKRKKAEEALKESEEKYRSVIENAPVVSWKSDREGHTSYISPNVKSVYGFTFEEIYNKGRKLWFERIHPDDKMKVLNSFKLLFDKGRNFDIQYRIKKKDGEWIWLHDKAVKLKEENGKLFAYGAFSDINERKKTEEKLKESREVFKTIVETAPSLLLITDKLGNITYISPNSEKFTGYNKEELIGKAKWWVHPDFLDKAKKLFEKTYKEELSGKDFQYKAIKKNGEVWYASSSWEPLRDNYGNFYGIIMQTIDITERKRREAEILKQFMRYEISEGNCYYVLEKSSLKSIKAFNDLLKIGLEGFILSREKKIDLKKQIKNNFNYLWIVEKDIKEGIQPKNIEKFVESIQKSSVIFIDRIDFLIQKISFKKTLTLLQRLNEIAYKKNHVILFSIDPATIAEDHLYLIKKEINSLELKRKVKLNDEQLEILKFIFEKNINNIKPSYSEIGNYLKQSKPTIRNKIRYLKRNGLLIENIKGSRKTLEISEKTRNILT